MNDVCKRWTHRKAYYRYSSVQRFHLLTNPLGSEFRAPYLDAKRTIRSISIAISPFTHQIVLQVCNIYFNGAKLITTYGVL